MISNRPPKHPEPVRDPVQMELDFGYAPLTPAERNAMLDAPTAMPELIRVQTPNNPLGVSDKEASDDPWRHRAENMRCSTCMWFSGKAGDVGRCRRHSPTMNGFPVVRLKDWCGDHKLDETKV